tara:strand:- start:2219 stop:3418 length:1200 start_codon:yes stop_codon:yes gene_type:complete
MAEIEKSIEELEQEVMAELQSADASDSPVNDIQEEEVIAEKKAPKNETKEVEDLGPAVTSPTDPKSASAKSGEKTKQTSTAQTKGAAPADKPETLKAEDMLKAISDKLSKADEKKLVAMYNNIVKEAVHTDEDDEDDDIKKELAKAKKEATEKRIKEIKVKEDVDALISGENELSDEFKDKASTIFEAAVKSKVRTEIERLEDEYSKELTEQSDKAKDELVEKVDSYLDYVVQEWMKENELAIERGLKGEISEDFIAGLKQLFEDHYIDVPDEKYDVLEAQSKKIEELEEQLNLQIEKDKELHSEIGELTKDSIIKDVSDDLVDTEVEKFKGLVEDVDYSDAESYKTKLETLKESYFPKRAEEQSTNEISDDEAVKEVETSGKMAEYMSAISKTHERAK